MADADIKLSLIMDRDRDGKLKLWACRGAGKGCQRNRYRTTQKPCVDCLPAHNGNETLGELYDRLRRGDA